MELTLAIRNKLASRGLCFDEQHLVMHDMALSLFTSICKSPNNSWVRQFSRSIPLDDRPPRRMLNHLAGVWEVFTVRRSSSRRLWSASEFTQNASEFPLLGFHARIYLTAQVVTDGNYKQEYVIEKFIMATFLFDFHL